MKFSEGVEYREAATKTQGARIAKARTLDAQLDPAAGTLQQARFTGNFDFTDGALRALTYCSILRPCRSDIVTF